MIFYSLIATEMPQTCLALLELIALVGTRASRRHLLEREEDYDFGQQNSDRGGVLGGGMPKRVGGYSNAANVRTLHRVCDNRVTEQRVSR